MRRILVLIALAFPASATAAPFGELPFRTVPTAAVCVRATGVPGELTRWTPGGMTVMQARADGLHDTAFVALGTQRQCPAVAADATTGAAVAAGAYERNIRVALRAPGGGWGPVETIETSGYPKMEAGVSARGDAVIAWVEYGDADAVARTRIARHVAGTNGWTVDELTPFLDYEQISDDEVLATMSANGEAFVVFAARGADKVLVTPPSGPPPAAQTLMRSNFGPASALAVAPDGRALVAIEGRVFERPPGGAFARVDHGPAADVEAIALRPDGAAVLAGSGGSALVAKVRDAPGPFGEVIRSEVKVPERKVDGLPSFGAVDPGDTPYEFGSSLRLALGGDGRALAVHPTADRGFAAATLTSAGVTEHLVMGSPLRVPTGLTPLILPDGTRAIAWTDNRGQLQDGAQHGRLHYAVEGALGAPAPVPDVTVLAPRKRALRPAETLRLPVRCSAACDLRAWQPGDQASYDLTATSTGPGIAELRFGPRGDGIAPKNGRPLKLRLRFGAPGSAVTRERTISVRLKRLPAPPLPQFRNLRVRRIGNDLDVRWDADVPARDAYYFVYGHRTKDLEKDRNPAIGAPRSKGLHPRVRLKDAARARYVTVAVLQFFPGAHRTQTIRVGS